MRGSPEHMPALIIFSTSVDITGRYLHGGRKAAHPAIEAIPDLAYPQATVTTHGPLAELADAMDSKSIARKGVSVRLR
jgi:hypothetical protein